AAAAAWDGLAAELQAAMTSFGSVTSGLAGGSWLGTASVAMTAAAVPYVGWLGTSAAQAAEAAGLARVAAGAFEAARSATVDLGVVAANRAQLVSLVTSNLFGQNAPAIAAVEAAYEQMWAQDVAALVGYHGVASALAAQLSPWQLGLQSALSVAGARVALPSTPTLSTATARAAEIAMTRTASAVNDVALVMGGSGLPIPGPRYVDAANLLFIERSAPAAIIEALFTPQGLYPVTGTKSLTFDISVAQGVTILDTAIRQQIAAGNSVTVFGYSQSATIASLEMVRLASSISPPSMDQLSFVLAANPSNPNGGIAARFAGLALPSLGATASGATPDNLYPTSSYTIEYDGVADFPRYPINILANLNALAGIYYLHPTYMMLTPEQINSAIPLTNTVGPTMTNYYIIPTKNLPLLEPLRALPIMGNPLADLIQPNLKVLVNLGYGDPAYGYSTTAPNVATPFELFPPVSPLTVANHLVAGTQQGVNDFAYGMAKIDLPSLPAVPNLLMAGPTTTSAPGTALMLSPAVSP
ncbi:PPE family protein, partial [Mycobacterium simiae]